MLIIRLQRAGKRNQAHFRIVLAEKTAPVEKKFVEVLGNYDPRKKGFQVKEERLKYWIDQKVQLSETVHNLLVTKNLLQAAKVKAFNIPKKPVEPAAAQAAPASAESPAATEPSSSAEANPPVVEEVPKTEPSASTEQKPVEPAA